MSETENSKTEEKGEKKKSKAPLVLLPIALIAAGAAYFMMPGGGGQGVNLSPGTAETAEAQTDAEKPSAEESNKAEITVSKDSYLYEGKEVTLDELDDILASLDKEKTFIIIRDDNASLNPYKELLDKVKGEGFSVTEEKGE